MFVRPAAESGLTNLYREVRRTEKNYAKYTRILNQAKLDYEKRREKSIQDIKVSRFKTVNRMMRWMARKMD